MTSQQIGEATEIHEIPQHESSTHNPYRLSLYPSRELHKLITDLANKQHGGNTSKTVASLCQAGLAAQPIADQLAKQSELLAQILTIVGRVEARAAWTAALADRALDTGVRALVYGKAAAVAAAGESAIEAQQPAIIQEVGERLMRLLQEAREQAFGKEG